MEMYFSCFSSADEIAEKIDIQILQSIYPTNDYLLDLRLEKILSLVGLEHVRIKAKNSNEFFDRLEDCIHPNNLMEPLLLLENCSLRHKKTMDPWYAVLENFGFNTSEMFGALFYSKNVNERMNCFISNMLKIPVENTFLKSCIMQQCVIAVISQALKNKRTDLCMLINKLQIPVIDMDAFRRSRILPPKDCRYVTEDENDNEEKTSLNMEGVFCEIARTEDVFLKKDFSKIDIQNFSRALVPKSCTSVIQPAWMESLIEMDTWIYSENDESYYLELSYPDMYFQKERFIWLNPYISYQLGIDMYIDYVGEGIIGMNEQEEVVLKMKNWRCAYYGNSDYRGQEFPMSRGCILYMREDYVKKMESLYGKMVWKEEKQ